jgi:hypothetical protein
VSALPSGFAAQGRRNPFDERHELPELTRDDFNADGLNNAAPGRSGSQVNRSAAG